MNAHATTTDARATRTAAYATRTDALATRTDARARTTDAHATTTRDLPATTMRTPGLAAEAAPGFTLLEVMLSAFILSAIILMTVSILNGGNKLLLSVSLNSEAEVKSADLADQIAKRMLNGVVSTLRDGTGAAFADGATTTNGVTIRLISGYQGAAVLGETYRYTLVDQESNTSDGIDNDGNNLIDEKKIRLQRWPDGNTAAAPTQDQKLDINLRSLSITRAGNVLRIAVVVERYEPINRVLKSVTARSNVTLKN